MEKYKSYMNRVLQDGDTPKLELQNSTKRQAHENIINSPSRSDVLLNDEEDTRPSIVSDIETFNKRSFLFLPDSVVNVGNYIKHKDMTYLAVDTKKIDEYPELIAELCNEVFVLKTEGIRIEVGTDWRGAPVYEDIAPSIKNIPCSLTTKVYSALSNSAIPLPTGAMIVKIPYNIEYHVPLNYSFKVRDVTYKVTDVKYEKVVNEVGFIEINFQREVSNNET